MIPEVGKRYCVTISDCCVEGGFEASAVSVDYNDREGWLDSIVFDNGVELTNCMGVKFEEVAEPGR